MPEISRFTPVARFMLVIGAVSAGGAATAQQTGSSFPAGTGVQKVEITGSRIKQIDAEGASPVEVIGRDDIVRSGATTVTELLATLTAASTDGNSITDINGSNTFAPGASQASLRNLGAHATLVLLNGRRIALYPLPNFQETFSNLDSIPLAAVERVEVLKIGGSAIYGSDAIAGVINFITRRQFQGVEAGVSDQTSTRNGRFGERSASLTAGFDRGDLGLLADLEAFERDPVFWSQVASSVNPAYGRVSPGFGQYSSYSYPGNIDFHAITGPGIAACTDGALTAGRECTYNRLTRIEAVPATRRLNGIVSGHKKLDDDRQLSGEFDFSYIRANYQTGHPAYGPSISAISWLDPVSGQNHYFYERGLPVGHPLNTTGEDENTNDFRYRFLDSPSQSQVDTFQYRLLANLTGTFGAWDIDSAVGVLGATTHDDEQGGFSHAGFLKEIGDYGHLDATCTPLPDGSPDPTCGQLTPVAPDFFNVPGGYRIGQPNSPEVLATLFPVYGWTAVTRQQFIDGNATRDLGRFGAGPVSVSAGFELRHESMALTPTQNLRDGDIVGYSFSAADGARSFGALFSELKLRPTPRLETGLAGRLDKFPGFGAHFSPRANVRYQPGPSLLLRGTVETGFRAPNLQESSTSTKTAYQPGVTDPQRCPAATQIANDLYAQAAKNPDSPDASRLIAQAEQLQNNECAASVPFVALNNPALKPERALSASFGGVLQIARHWSVGADWWSIERKNEINLKSVQNLLAAESSQAPGVVNRAPLNPHIDPSFTAAQIQQYGITAGPLASVRLQYDNLFKTRTSGIDFDLKGRTDLPFGALTTVVSGTWTLNYQAWSPTRYGSGGWGDDLAGRYGYPRWSTRVENTLALGRWSHTLRWVHQSAQALQLDWDDAQWSPAGCAAQGLAADACRVKAYDRVDYAVVWEGPHRLSLGAQLTNLFQRRPPIDLRAFGGSSGVIPTSVEDAQGRLLKVWLRLGLG